MILLGLRVTVTVRFMLMLRVGFSVNLASPKRPDTVGADKFAAILPVFTAAQVTVELLVT